MTTHQRKFQRGLHSSTKAVRVAAYVQNLSKEGGIIAHACGVRSPRELRRFHAHLVQADGRTIGLDQFYPESERQIVAALSWPQTWPRDQMGWRRGPRTGCGPVRLGRGASPSLSLRSRR
ncbi:hypothetical protein U5801_19465 [Lamprobacter modestohalophilus]|uniref:hypothetical protein n=1 Tax=Lamprobacter modestohalophilus TaxID=1064514 RepID=UPI002ADEF524|nr:hypothetical protein [Lamprobacter modestohalophilus]MEA1051968.1 hypothetical protein [Lamprobacter modestohalophilus]